VLQFTRKSILDRPKFCTYIRYNNHYSDLLSGIEHTISFCVFLNTLQGNKFG